jgi:hypothetical protein
MSRAIAALASLLFLAGCVLPGTVQARAFTTGFKAGDTIRYRVHTTISGAIVAGGNAVPLSSDLTLTQELHVQSVDKAGTATVEVTSLDIVGNATGGSATIKPSPVVLRIGPDGRIQSGSAAQVAGRIPSVPGSDQLTPVLPGHPVKPGDAWDKAYSRPNPFGSGEFSFTTHSRYLKDEAVGGRDASVIETTLQGPIDFTIDFSKLPAAAGAAPPASGVIHYKGAIDSTNRYWISLADHLVLKSTGSGTYRLSYALAVPSGQAGGPPPLDFNGTIKSDLTRI